MYALILNVVESIWGVSYETASGNVQLGMEIMAHVSIWLFFVAFIMFLVACFKLFFVRF